MEALFARVLKVNPPDITFVNVILWVAHCVEVYSTSVNTGKGASKFAIFRDSVPKFVAQAVASNLCTAAHGEAIVAECTRDWQRVSELVDALVAVAHDPQLLQWENEARACFAKCKR